MSPSRIWNLVMAAVLGTSLLPTSAVPPRIFFCDVTSGPKHGGENNNGLFVTIWGTGFGVRRESSTVTVGGGEVTKYVIWGQPWLWYQKITFQLGANVSTGNIVVHTSAGDSNGIPFTVRTGNVYFVATTGNNANPGSFAKPWATICHANDAMKPGDTVYVMNGVVQSADSGCASSGWGAAINITARGGTAARPIAFVAYPNATATIGNANAHIGGIRTPNLRQGASHYVFSQFHVIGGAGNQVPITLGSQASTPKSQDYRLIANEVTSPRTSGNFQGGGIHCSTANYMVSYGNYVHDIAELGRDGTTKGMHNIYYSTDCNHADVGWNEVDGSYHSSSNSGNACRGIVFHSSPVNGGGTGDATGQQQYDLHVHDNYIHDTHCDGVHFNTVDPANVNGTCIGSAGSQNPCGVEAYNNVIVRAGTGVLNGEVSNYACFFGNNGDNGQYASRGSATILLYNNSLYDCAAAGGGAFSNGGVAPGVTLKLQNNITYIVKTPSHRQTYLDGKASLIGGDHNLWYGGGTGPSSGFTNNVNADPWYANVTAGDLHLKPGSPAINAGVTIPGLVTDKDGIARPQGTAIDFGAYEFQNWNTQKDKYPR